MDEEIAIIDTKTRNEKIKSFFIKYKKLLITIAGTSILILLSFYSYQIYKDGHRERLANQYNSTVNQYEKNLNKSEIILSMKEIIKDKDSTYSPLGLYFLIDNNLIDNKNETNVLFDIVINEVNLKKEIKNLVIYKKALFNANTADENELIQMLNPVINSESIWKSHALFLMGEFFYAKKENQKAKEFLKKYYL